jgi:8-oxo-dGTP diphosphatase
MSMQRAGRASCEPAGRAATICAVRALRVIGAVVLSARGLLLVSKRSAPEVFYLPGGKPDSGEAPLACLRRELREELGVELAAAEPFAEVRAPAALEGVPMHMSVFEARVRGTPTPAAEIARLIWWPEQSDVQLAPAVRDFVIPRLRVS